MENLDLLIHDEVCEQARDGLMSIPIVWRARRRIRPYVVAWPSGDIEFHGYKTDEPVSFMMPDDRSEWSSFLIDVARNNKAYALLLVEQREQAVVAILESHHGTKSWHYPLADHGGTLLLRDPIEKTDTESIGLLWRPDSGTS
jgi:hypothetical protein